MVGHPTSRRAGVARPGAGTGDGGGRTLRRRPRPRPSGRQSAGEIEDRLRASSLDPAMFPGVLRRLYASRNASSPTTVTCPAARTSRAAGVRDFAAADRCRCPRRHRHRRFDDRWADIPPRDATRGHDPPGGVPRTARPIRGAAGPRDIRAPTGTGPADTTARRPGSTIDPRLPCADRSPHLRRNSEQTGRTVPKGSLPSLLCTAFPRPRDRDGSNVRTHARTQPGSPARNRIPDGELP